MIDDVYKNSFKEVFVILENTDEELLSKVPSKFINFIKDNMNTNYETNINPNLDVDKQVLLKETEAILSLIYRSYWATNEEKILFAENDKQYFSELESRKVDNYQGKDIYQIFEKRKNIDNLTLNNELMVIKKENFIQRFFTKILHIFRFSK